MKCECVTGQPTSARGYAHQATASQATPAAKRRSDQVVAVG